jgi:hypothetical protein
VSATQALRIVTRYAAISTKASGPADGNRIDHAGPRMIDLPLTKGRGYATEVARASVEAGFSQARRLHPALTIGAATVDVGALAALLIPARRTARPALDPALAAALATGCQRSPRRGCTMATVGQPGWAPTSCAGG